jgi:hypothetical protein
MWQWLLYGLVGFESKEKSNVQDARFPVLSLSKKKERNQREGWIVDDSVSGTTGVGFRHNNSSLVDDNDEEDATFRCSETTRKKSICLQDNKSRKKARQTDMEIQGYYVWVEVHCLISEKDERKTWKSIYLWVMLMKGMPVRDKDSLNACMKNIHKEMKQI